MNDGNFSIICNNCLGGFIYQHYNLEYRTPTLGLFIIAKDYIKFLKDIKSYLSKKLEFIKPDESKGYKSFNQTAEMMKFPVARLGDIEVFFMHYKDEKEATEKWYRRINKIRWNDLIVIMAENETCNRQVVEEFDKLSFKNKVSFTINDYNDVKSSCWVKEMQEPGKLWNAEVIMKHFDLTGFINNRVTE
ncbi:DUF1919 domain-containing protein [uncultured Clostridium sp.]|uniref:DUF1919 domain-containing protein n=1 Tax=uncultured Clostridium sp. TaxID=59620 RepID=UPI0025D6610F|nr:DUF1919 domain-containing protein [uncultured Clostridium sp.]